MDTLDKIRKIKENPNEIFSYLKEIAKLNEICNAKGESLLAKQYEKINGIQSGTALEMYLNPNKRKSVNSHKYAPIFPFGCNNSQYDAVMRAMNNQISVIQGPPGTGKTQTILNIIANILLQNKNVIVVSNNNAAIENVYEKLAKKENDLGFLVAKLGNSENKKKFIENQIAASDRCKNWNLDFATEISQETIYEETRVLKKLFDKQEAQSGLLQEKSQIDAEYHYFLQYAKNSDINVDDFKYVYNISAKSWLSLWQEAQTEVDINHKFGLLFKLKLLFKYTILDYKLYKQEPEKFITICQWLYYKTRIKWIISELEKLSTELADIDINLPGKANANAMLLLKRHLYAKYADEKSRTIFKEEDLFYNWEKIQDEYPIILSTTFSAKACLNKNAVYDYLIMDEASQVDIATGALALSCAKNAIIVGDTKQLPNVIKSEAKQKSEEIFKKYKIALGYKFYKSFLNSVVEIMPDVPQTMLREHYRCHPKIINYCNQKFYHNNLVVMTKDNGEKDVIMVMRTVEGNHRRENYNQREIDVIKNEILPMCNSPAEEIGIIAPYNGQVDKLKEQIKGIDISTVHKFQGREKETIILTTVDDKITDFVDNPYLLNVAVSRARKRLILVVTGNKQSGSTNIMDLMHYIQYNNFSIQYSNINSIFDYLYKAYKKEREAYLGKHTRISEYKSENLVYALLEDILADDKYQSLDVVCHMPLNILLKDISLLNEAQQKYAMNSLTHIDLLVYNKFSKMPILAIEVDGWQYHNEKTPQAKRDKLKNEIMNIYNIELLRLVTNGSGEREKIINTLDRLLGIKDNVGMNF